jgi:hypothetical protein
MSPPTWADLKPEDRVYLLRACTQGLNPKNRLIPKDVIERLLEAGLIAETTNKKGRPLWRPTADGIILIASRGLEPTFLHQRSEYGYTNRASQAMSQEPEVMDESATVMPRTTRAERRTKRPKNPRRRWPTKGTVAEVVTSQLTPAELAEQYPRSDDDRSNRRQSA